MDQLMPTPARVGSGSFRTTFSAGLSPSLVTVIVKPTLLPAVTVCASAVLTTFTCGCGVTIVIVLQSGSLAPATQLDLVTTTTLGSEVWPAGQPAEASFTKYLNVSEPLAGTVWLAQDRKS